MSAHQGVPQCSAESPPPAAVCPCPLGSPLCCRRPPTLTRTTSSARALAPCPVPPLAATTGRASGRTCRARSRRGRACLEASPQVGAQSTDVFMSWGSLDLVRVGGLALLACWAVLHVQSCVLLPASDRASHLPPFISPPLPPCPPSAASPTMGFAVPHHGSLSSGGSPPYGLSPAGQPPPSLFGGGSTGLHAFGAPAPGGLHLGLANGPGRS